jgi:hypothetical protein
VNVASLFASLGLQVNEASWARGTELITNMKRALGFFIGFEAVKGVVELVESVGDAAVAAERLSQKLGVSTKDIQELGYAAKVSGVDAQEMQVGMQKLAKGLEEARTKGSGPVAETFAKLGVSMSDPAIKSKDLGQTIELLADKFKAMPDNADKTALAIDLFGRSGTALIPMLNQGRDGIEAFRAEAERLGIVVDQDTAKSFEELEHTQKRLSGTWQGIKTQIAVALLPALKDLAESVLDWVQANREAIQSGIHTAVAALTIVFKGLGLAVEACVAIFDFFDEHSDLATAVIVALGAVIAAFAVEAAAAWLLAFWPVALVVAIIAAIVLVVMDLWKSITTGKGVFATVFRWIARQAREFWEGLKAIGKGIGGFFVDVATAIKDAFTAAFEWIAAKAEWLGDKVTHIPVLRQFAEALGKGAGFVARQVVGDEAEEGAYETAVAAGQFSGTEEEFNAQRARNMNTVSVAPRAGSGVQTATGTVVNDNSTTTFNVSSPNADPKAVADQVDARVKDHWDAQMRTAHAATGGADQ